MSFGHPCHMPAAAATLNANMFRPPLSPSSSSYNLAKSTGSLFSDTSMLTGSNTQASRLGLGRKRTHDESNNTRGFPFPRARTGGPLDSPTDDHMRGEHARYALAGQIETPGAPITPGSGAMEDSLYSDIDYRRALGPKRPLDEADAGMIRRGNEGTGEPMSPSQAGWTTFAFQAIGGVVGKVWEFCRAGSGVFRGFQAGGGKAFEFNGQPIPTLAPGPGTATYSAVMDAEARERPDSPLAAAPVDDERAQPLAYHTGTQEPTVFRNYFRDRMDEAAAAPNPFRESSYLPTNDNTQPYEPMVIADFFLERMSPEPIAMPNPFQTREPSPTSTSDQPAAKRRQTGPLNEADPLRKNWVMVEEDERVPAPARTACNAKKMSAASSRIPAANRSSLGARMQPSPRFSTPNAGRRMSAPPARSSDRSSIPTFASSKLSMAPPASFAGATSPALSAREPASYASPRSPARAPVPSPCTPLGSRIPTPKSSGANPFANTRTLPPAPPRFPTTGPRPSSRGSSHPSPFAPHSASRLTTPAAGHRKSMSSTTLGSTRGGRSSLGYERAEKVQTSPRLDDEGRHLATKRLATEKRNYSRLDKLNMELQGLIRQGQEALGTNFDIDMDESWEEDA